MSIKGVSPHRPDLVRSSDAKIYLPMLKSSFYTFPAFGFAGITRSVTLIFLLVSGQKAEPLAYEI